MSLIPWMKVEQPVVVIAGLVPGHLAEKACFYQPLVGRFELPPGVGKIGMPGEREEAAQGGVTEPQERRFRLERAVELDAHDLVIAFIGGTFQVSVEIVIEGLDIERVEIVEIPFAQENIVGIGYFMGVRP